LARQVSAKIPLNVDHRGTFNPPHSYVVTLSPTNKLELVDVLLELRPPLSLTRFFAGDGSFPNKYCLSKALGEALLHRHRGTVPIAILRPSFVVSAHQDPSPGWIDNVSGLVAIHMLTMMGRCPVGPRHLLFSPIPAHVSRFI